MNIQDSLKTINQYLDLDRKPVGVKFFFDKESFLAFDAPIRTNKITYCNSVQIATNGKKFKYTKEHQACPNGAFALNFTDVPEPIKNGKGRFSKGIYENPEISASINDDMKFMPERPYGLGVMPLEDFTTEPDVVILVSNPYNIMRIIQGNSYKNGYSDNIRTCGLQAVCQDLTTYPYVTGDINITMLCPGTRLVASWKPNDVGIGMPFDKWYDIVEGVKATTNAFARNDVKEGIKSRLRADGEDDSHVLLDQNYDDGSYKGGRVDPASFLTEEEIATQQIGAKK